MRLGILLGRVLARPWSWREKKQAAKHKCLTAFNLQNEAEGTRTLNLRIDSPSRASVSFC